MEINRENLLKAMDKVSVVIKQKSTLPIIENIKIEIKDTKCIVSATNLETTMITKFEVPKSEDVSICVNPKDIKAFLNEITPDTVVLTIAQRENDKVYTGTLTIEYGIGSEITFPLVDSTEFPSTPAKENPKVEFICQSASLRRLIFANKGYVSTDELKPSMQAMSLDVNEKGLRGTATNAHVLHTLGIDEEISVEGDVNFLMSKECMIAVSKLSNGEVKVTECDSHLFFESDVTTIVSSQVDGKYPNWRSVVPTEYEAVITINRANFLKGVKIASLSSGSTAAVKFVAKDKVLEISAEDVDYAKKGSFKMPLNNIEGAEEMIFGLSAKFTKQIIESTPEVDELNFNVNKSRACTLGKIDAQLILVMPVIIQ